MVVRTLSMRAITLSTVPTVTTPGVERDQLLSESRVAEGPALPLPERQRLLGREVRPADLGGVADEPWTAARSAPRLGGMAHHRVDELIGGQPRSTAI
jgi:hypothetical protein